MGQQQLLLILLGSIIVGLAAYGGVRYMDAYNQDHNRDQIILHMKQLTLDLERFSAAGTSSGGGGGSFSNYRIPKTMTSTPIGTFMCTMAGNYAVIWGTGVVKGTDKRTPVGVVAVYYNKQFWSWTTN